MVWLNILCKSGCVIFDVIYVRKHGSFNRRQNFNKSIKTRKRLECINNDEGIRPEKLTDEKVAADHDLQERHQTHKLSATSSAAKKVVLAQARIREKSNVRLVFHDRLFVV